MLDFIASEIFCGSAGYVLHKILVLALGTAMVVGLLVGAFYSIVVLWRFLLLSIYCVFMASVCGGVVYFGGKIALYIIFSFV